jgi:hypothetical protein
LDRPDLPGSFEFWSLSEQNVRTEIRSEPAVSEEPASTNGVYIRKPVARQRNAAPCRL